MGSTSGHAADTSTSCTRCVRCAVRLVSLWCPVLRCFLVLFGTFGGSQIIKNEAKLCVFRPLWGSKIIENRITIVFGNALFFFRFWGELSSSRGSCKRLGSVSAARPQGERLRRGLKELSRIHNGRCRRIERSRSRRSPYH